MTFRDNVNLVPRASFPLTSGQKTRVLGATISGMRHSMPQMQTETAQQSRSQSPLSFGQRQDTELWNNPFQESKILRLPVSRRMRALALKWRPEVKTMWIRSTTAFNEHSHRLFL